jgi:hypothetical protein
MNKLQALAKAMALIIKNDPAVRGPNSDKNVTLGKQPQSDCEDSHEGRQAPDHLLDYIEAFSKSLCKHTNVHFSLQEERSDYLKFQRAQDQMIQLQDEFQIKMQREFSDRQHQILSKFKFKQVDRATVTQLKEMFQP